MRLGKKAQYALLLVLYLARSGRSRTVDAAEGLGLSASFLEQIARKLRQAALIRSIHGPGGGYELASDPTVGQVLEAVNVQPILTNDETRHCAESTIPEVRTLGEIVGAISFAVGLNLKVTVSEFGKKLAAAEVAQLDSVSAQSTVQ